VQYQNTHTMANSQNIPSTKTIILVGLLGCFLTSVAGVSGSMLMSGWDMSGGWSEWIKRLGLGYPCACLVVLTVFPRMVPKMTRFLENQ
jgi:hypothetical protein